MNTGDFAFYKNGSTSMFFIVYNKYYLITCNLFGIKLLLRDYAEQTYGPLEYYSFDKNVGPNKRRQIKEFLYSLISKERKLSFKEKIGFLKYILFMYDSTFNLTVMNHTSLPHRYENVIESKILIKTNNKDIYDTKD